MLISPLLLDDRNDILLKVGTHSIHYAPHNYAVMSILLLGDLF